VSAHVDFVAILFIIWGVLTALIGLSMLSLGVGAVAILASANRAGAPAGPGNVAVAAGLTAATFGTLAIIAIIWGAAHVAVGVPLRRRRPAARILALTLGAVDIVLLPYGTALGCYAMWVLLNEEGKKLFNDAPRQYETAK
jgi:hypothetical protein